jgi:digeranylgeranylglycerophospholipid reductase
VPEHVDVLVVGAGPAGSIAARVAARAGLSVLLVERRPCIGIPVQCAEYVPAQIVQYAPLP